MRTTTLRKRLTVLVAAGTMAAGLGLASAATAGPAGAGALPTTAHDATVTVVHGIPGAGGVPVDIHVDGTVDPNLSGLTFGQVSPPQSLAPGTYTVAVKTAAAPVTTVATATVTLTADENATITANLDTAGAPALNVFANPTALAPAGEAWVVVRHVADAPGVDVYSDSTKVITGLTNPNSAGPIAVPAGPLTASVKLTGTATSVLGPQTLDLAAGNVYIVYAIGDATATPSTLTDAVQVYGVGNTSRGANQASVTVVHGVPNLPVNVWLQQAGTATWVPALVNYQFGEDMTLYAAPGTYNVGLTAVDVAPTAPNFVLSANNVALTANENATITANLSSVGAPTLNVFANSQAPTPGGDAFVTVRHIADAPCVDVYAGDAKVISGLCNLDGNSSDTLAVPAGPLTVQVAPGGDIPPVTPVIGPVTLSLVAGHSYIVYAIGSYNGPPTAGLNPNSAKPALPSNTLTAVVQDIVVGQATTGEGYRQVASDGGIFAFGTAKFFGSMGGTTLNAPMVGIANTGDGMGYWTVASDGGIFAFGTAKFFGSMGGTHLNKPVVGVVGTPDSLGYWLVASDGGIFAFGDAAFYGSTGGTALNKPVVGGASTPDGMGYWLVASDGGVFAFGDAAFSGSTGGITLNKPILGMDGVQSTTSPAAYGGTGYWLAASDGGVFAFGTAGFFGSAGNITLNKPVVGVTTTPTNAGYWLVASDGGVFSYGDASFHGSMGGTPLNKPVVGMATI